MSATATGWRLGYRPELDGLRGLAVVIILWHHAQLDVFAGGRVGVDVFFVLSGFLITSLLIEELVDTGVLRFAAFWARRALRLLPALIVFVAVVYVLADLTVPNTRNGALPALLYYTNWYAAAGGPTGGGFGHTWSLAIEEQFYLLWPILLYAMWRLDRTLQLALWASIGLAVASTVARIYAAGRVPFEEWYNNFAFRFDAILIGCILAIIVHTRPLPQWLSDRHTATFGLCLLAFTVFRELTLNDERVWEFFVDVRIMRRFAASQHTLAALATMFIIAGLISGVAPWLSRVFSHRAAVWMGVRSYGIYLWHWPIMRSDLLESTTWTGRVIGVTVTLVVAALSYRFVEMPFLRLKRRLSPVARARPIAVSAG